MNIAFNSKNLNKTENEILNYVSDEDLIKNAKKLLFFLQDINWPTGQVVAKKLIPLLNEIEMDILNILNSDDLEWKINLLNGVILHQTKPLPENILAFILKTSNIVGQNITEEWLVDICKNIISNTNKTDKLL